MKQVMVLYVPVIHKGYLDFFRNHAHEVECLYILGQELIEDLTFLEQEIRAVDPLEMRRLLDCLGLFREVKILRPGTLLKLAGYRILTANEGISQRFAQKYCQPDQVKFESVFLRWDETHVTSCALPSTTKVSNDLFDKTVMELACEEAQKSSDWWRQVGAVAVRHHTVILTGFNHHVPSEHTPYVFGDIRDFIEAGKQPEISSVVHAEQDVVTQAAKNGIPLEGCSIYVSTFPCPVCAKLVAYSGFRACYFRKGHVTFDSENILKANRVLVIHVP